MFWVPGLGFLFVFCAWGGLGDHCTFFIISAQVPVLNDFAGAVMFLLSSVLGELLWGSALPWYQVPMLIEMNSNWISYMVIKT